MSLHACCTLRLLVFHWTWPVPLEPFFQPPEGGLDWRVKPEYRSVGSGWGAECGLNQTTYLLTYYKPDCCSLLLRQLAH